MTTAFLFINYLSKIERSKDSISFLRAGSLLVDSVSSTLTSIFVGAIKFPKPEKCLVRLSLKCGMEDNNMKTPNNISEIDK